MPAPVATESKPAQENNMNTPETVAPIAANAAPPTPAIVAELEAENAALRERVSQLESKKIEEDSIEAKVLVKMAKGLTRPQARAAVLNQAAFDASKLGKKNAARYAMHQARDKAT